MKMTKREATLEDEVLQAYDKGQLKSTSPSKARLKHFKTSARATFIKDRRVNVRLSSPDLMDIQARAAEEGVPYQTLISSVLHKSEELQAPRTSALFLPWVEQRRCAAACGHFFHAS